MAHSKFNIPPSMQGYEVKDGIDVQDDFVDDMDDFLID